MISMRFGFAFVALIATATSGSAQTRVKGKQQGYDSARTTSPSKRIGNRLQNRIDTRLKNRLEDSTTRAQEGLQSYSAAAEAAKAPQAKSDPGGSSPP